MTLHGPVESHTEIGPHACASRQHSPLLPHFLTASQEVAPTIIEKVIHRDSEMVSDLPRVALPSGRKGRGCPVPPDAVE